MTVYCLQQAEVAIFIIAQTIPVLRVLLLREPRSSEDRLVGSIAGLASGSKTDKRKSPTIDDVRKTSIKLVQLSSGKIVAAESEEGRAFKASAEENEATGQTRAATFSSIPEQTHAVIAVTIDDEVHRNWSDMGLSRRAWSQSPSPPPGARHQPPNLSGSV